MTTGFKKVTRRYLPGAADRVTSIRVISVSNALEWLRRGMPITASGDHGSLDVYRGVDGAWHVQFMRHRELAFGGQYTQLASVHQWLRDWFPKLRAE